MRAHLQFGLLLTLAGISGCADLPRDPEGTTERVTRSHKLVLGAIDGAPISSHARSVLSKVTVRLDASVVVIGGPGEQLLEDLETGKVDLVFGHFAQNSPWAKNVHLGRPLGRREKVPKDERVPRFAFRHGENGWIALVERADQ